MKLPKNEKETHDFQDLVDDARDLIKVFKLHDPRPWPLEINGLDLASHTGLIAQALLEKQGYKPIGNASKTLGKELAIMMFIILDIAGESVVDFEKILFEFLKETRETLASPDERKDGTD